MTEQEEFFSPNHNRLLNIATWAKYLAWVVLVVYILWAAGTYIQEQNMLLFCNIVSNVPYSNLRGLLKEIPFYGLSVLMEIVGIFLKGVVYFLVLRGVSLGLNMIVETDINYREVQNEQSS